MRGIRTLIQELWWYLTYDYYGRRRLRPAAYALLLTLGLVAVVFLWAFFQSRQALPAERPAPTLPPPTATAIFATATAIASRPTATPAPLCPEDPRVWALVEIRPFLDPKTGKSVQLPKPPQRIDPPCVYEALARDLARTLVPNPDVPIPSATGRTLSVPWFWAPGTEIIQTQVIPRQARDFVAFYDARGRKIDDLYLPYTAVATGDPDFPVLVYIYQDEPQLAWGTLHQEGEEDLWVRYEIRGGEVDRTVLVMVYDAKARRWVPGLYPRDAPRPRSVHAVPAGSAEDLAGLLGLPLWRRGELLARAGLKDIFPDSVNPAALKPAATFVISPEGMERR